MDFLQSFPKKKKQPGPIWSVGLDHLEVVPIVMLGSPTVLAVGQMATGYLKKEKTTKTYGPRWGDIFLTQLAI